MNKLAKTTKQEQPQNARPVGSSAADCYVKLPPIKKEDLHIRCLNCSVAFIEAPMDMIIAVGFGSAIATKDGAVIYDELTVKNDNYMTVEEIESIAKKEPNCDWRIQMDGPLHGETFQRQGENKWVCVESNRGFA